MNTQPTGTLPSPKSVTWVDVSIVSRKLTELSAGELKQLIIKLRTMKKGKVVVCTALQKSINKAKRTLSKTPDNTTIIKLYAGQTEILVKCKGDIQKLSVQIFSARNALLKAKAAERKANRRTR